jgi:hypothetical protein
MKQLAVFRRLRGFSGRESPVFEWGATLLLLGLLAAPSIWMLSVIPPLWKDIDAYIQVTQPPGVQTILQYGPLYCLIARIPLYFGFALECLRAGNPVPSVAFFFYPTLTDSGVLALLLSQHMALCFSAFYLISVVSRRFLVRLLLAGVWAFNPLFYTFAHCVGSEALSMILLLLFGATGIRIISHRRNAPRTEWLLLGLLLWLSILTRHLNVLLAMLMPATFLLLSAHRLIVAAFTRSKLIRRGQRLWARHSLQQAAIALVIGLSCIVLANVSLRGLCYAANIPYQFQAGPSFLGRLEFLARLPSKKADEFLDQITRDTSAPDVKKIISQLRGSHPRNDGVEIDGFHARGRSVFVRAGVEVAEGVFACAQSHYPGVSLAAQRCVRERSRDRLRKSADDHDSERCEEPFCAHNILLFASRCHAWVCSTDHFSRQECERDTSLLQAIPIFLPSKGV